VSWPSFLILTAGCGATITSTTSVDILDPSRVALLRGDGEQLLSAGGSAEIKSLGSVEPTQDGGSDIALAVERTDTGQIIAHWDTLLPIVNGNAQALVPRTGLRDVPAPPLPSPATPNLRIDACTHFEGHLVTHVTHNGRARYESYEKTGYDAQAVPLECDAAWSRATSFQLETPWDNVVIHRKLRSSPTARKRLSQVGGVFGAVAVLSIIPGAYAASRHDNGVATAILGTALTGIVVELVLSMVAHSMPDSVTIETLAPDGTVLSRAPATPER